MEVKRERPSSRGPAEWFTGDVWIKPIAQGNDRPGGDVIVVHFAPGARTA